MSSHDHDVTKNHNRIKSSGSSPTTVSAKSFCNILGSFGEFPFINERSTWHRYVPEFSFLNRLNLNKKVSVYVIKCEIFEMARIIALDVQYRNKNQM